MGLNRLTKLAYTDTLQFGLRLAYLQFYKTGHYTQNCYANFKDKDYPRPSFNSISVSNKKSTGTKQTEVHSSCTVSESYNPWRKGNVYDIIDINK